MARGIPTMPSHLLVREKGGTTRRVSLEGDQISLGRSHENDLCFPGDASLSRRHLILERAGDRWTVRDLGSKNGTLVNGVAVSGSQAVGPGDRISAGHISLAIEDPMAVADDSVEFFAGPPSETPTAGTVVTSLEGVLSGEDPIVGAEEEIQAGSVEPGGKLARQPAVAALLKAGRELAGDRPLAELFQLILDLAIEAMGAERGLLMTLEGEKLVPRAVHGEGFRISATVRDRVLREKASILVRDTLLDEAFRSRESISAQQIRTMMAVPLQTEERVIGLIYVDSRFFTRQFTADDLELLTVLANHAAIRIEHERLEEVERVKQFMSRDLEQAAQIQRSFLPDRSPEVAGLEIAGHNSACQTVGGDYYDFFTYPDGRVAVVLADVAGKGMPAALLMSNLQARVQVLAEEPGDLREVMSRLNRIVSNACPLNRFVSLFYCVLNSANGEMTYCNAGHNPPLLVRADGRVEWIQGAGTILGILPDVRYEKSACRLEPGEFCAIFSDGVTEAVNPHDEEFGEERLAELLSAARGQPIDQVLESVLQGVEEWRAGAPQADDVTLVIARRSG
jgi:serine phosphatase RsbU (regulator of sigma subunit)